MFQLIEKAGQRKAVYSKSDLSYMQARGWQPVKSAPVVEHEPVKPTTKRKYTRKAK